MASSRVVSALLALGALSGCATAPPPETPAVEAIAVEPSVAPTPQPIEVSRPDKGDFRITIASVGDMMLGTDFPENHLPDDDGVGFLADVAPFLQGADVAVGNLEGVLMDGGEPAKQCSNPRACYLFRSPSRYATYFRDAGFDALSVANNHARDFGEDGRTASMAALASVGIHHSGREGDFASFESGGLTIAFLAFAVTRESNLLHDYDLARNTVRDFAADHDIVIVSFHGGAEGPDVTRLPFAEEEYYGEPRGDVVRFARMAVDAGADLVIGHGPHVIRAMERYRGRFIAYSLGNFATYYGISVAGIKGIAPILVTTLDGNGRFVEGEIVSTVQNRPAGPSVDQEGRALRLAQELSVGDFGNPGLVFGADGHIAPTPRDEVDGKGW